jgi:hypothetical protein
VSSPNPKARKPKPERSANSEARINRRSEGTQRGRIEAGFDEDIGGALRQHRHQPNVRAGPSFCILHSAFCLRFEVVRSPLSPYPIPAFYFERFSFSPFVRGPSPGFAGAL